jgi:hypothetical protein
VSSLVVKRDIHAFVSGPFRAHGQIEMWREGAVVRLRAQGPFNREAVQALGDALRDLLQQDPPPAHFADVLELQGSMMTSPEALADFEQFLARMAQLRNPPAAVAYVVPPEVEGRELMLPLFARLYARHGRQFAAFDRLEPALTWIGQQLQAGNK